MNLLVLQWNAYTYTDIFDTLKQLNINYHSETYYFKDKNKDSFFTDWFSQILKASSYDAVFTVNYFPLVADVCHQLRIKYLSWCYDCPLNVIDIEQTLGYETNYVFLFDRIQAEAYWKRGFQQVYHLPLAVNIQRLDRINVTSEELARYSSDISFVGNLYQSTYPMLSASMHEYTRGYLNGLIDMQYPLYGQFIFEETITDKLIHRINQEYRTSGTNIELNKAQLVYSLSTYVTHMERLQLLQSLSEQHQVHLYSGESHPMLSQVTFCGPVSYVNDMPKVFRHSKINLNITVKNTQSGIPLRALDIMGCQGFLLSNYQPELAEYFIPDTDFVYYESLEDAVEKADFYLQQDTLRTQIAQNGYQKVKDNFSYTKQFCKLLEFSGLSPHLS